jgi:Ser/Thr protein kinase RdoA (MazF antagonist)
LQWLAAQNFPALRVRPTLAGELVGTHGGWWSCLLIYVEGHMVEPHSGSLRAVGAALAQLHALGQAPGASVELPASTWHPATAIPATLEVLSATAGLPHSLQPLRRGLLDAAQQLEQRTDLLLSVVHGDCWHTNAIQTEHGGIVFVDWDSAGWGLPVLDLGQLLLASHHDLAQPLRLEHDPQRIAAILEGYTAHRPLSPAERQTLLSAMRFGLAHRFAPALVEAAQGQRDVDDVVIRKLQLRFDACTEIAAIADAWLA